MGVAGSSTIEGGGGGGGEGGSRGRRGIGESTSNDSTTEENPDERSISTDPREGEGGSVSSETSPSSSITALKLIVGLSGKTKIGDKCSILPRIRESGLLELCDIESSCSTSVSSVAILRISIAGMVVVSKWLREKHF